MRHKMMINEFIGRCSSNKGWRAPVRRFTPAAWRRRSAQLGLASRAAGPGALPSARGPARALDTFP